MSRKNAYKNFVDQLRELGYVVEENTANRVTFEYTIPVGKFRGQTIKLGFQVPLDFPASPPTGPHVSPHLLPLNPHGGKHPKEGVHASPAFGENWQYWSRPFLHTWPNTERDLRAYMAFIRKLFETQ
jgi:hypothetical protein